MDPDPPDVYAVLHGAPAAYAALVTRHQGAVRAVLRGYLGNRTGVDDLAQEVFLRAWRALRTWRPRRGSFRTWLLAIARNRARDHLRRARRRPRELSLPADPAARPDPAPDPAPRLDAALASLPPERRVVFLLADVHGVPLDEIARLEDVPVGTVKSRLDRARKALRAALEAARGPS